MGEWNLNSGGGAQDGSDSGNNLNLDPSLAQCFELFPAPAEDEGIPAFQADHLKPQERVLRQQAIDLLLWSALLSATFADIHSFSCRRNQPQNFGTDEFIVQHHISLPENLSGF